MISATPNQAFFLRIPADQPGEERGGPTLGTQIPGLHRDLAPRGKATGGAKAGPAVQGPAEADPASEPGR